MPGPAIARWRTVRRKARLRVRAGRAASARETGFDPQLLGLDGARGQLAEDGGVA